MCGKYTGEPESRCEDGWYSLWESLSASCGSLPVVIVCYQPTAILTRRVPRGSSTHKQASRVQASVGALHVQKTWFTIKARGVNEARRSTDRKNVGKINTF